MVVYAIFFLGEEMSNTDIKWFTYSNNNAPQLSNDWGCMINVLSACLVDGFGSQSIVSLTINEGVATAVFNNNHNFKQFQVVEISGADEPLLNKEFKILALTANTIEFIVDISDQVATGPLVAKLASLGWDKVFSGTNKAVYQAKDKIANPYYLRVDNSQDPVYNSSYAKFSKVGILESCSGIDDISGRQVPNNITNWVGTGSSTGAISGWFKWYNAVQEGAASSSSSYEIEAPSNGVRKWVLIGNKDSFFIVNSVTVSSVLEIPYGFGVVERDEINTPFLIATVRYAVANSGVLCSSSLSNTSKNDVAAFSDYSGSYVDKNLSRLIVGMGNATSGSASNTIQTDPITGNFLTPFYLVDSNNYILGQLPIVFNCFNNATSTANYSLFSDDLGAYIACRIRSGSGGVLGCLFFKIS